MRTDAEIVARIEARREDDILGFEWPYYLMRLPYELAVPYLKPEALEESAKKWQQVPRDHDSIRAEAIDYMAFAFDKANNCRGISAGRSISHYVAWLWLLGEDSWGDKLFDEYEWYGKDLLVRLCKFFGIDHRQWDDGLRTNGGDLTFYADRPWYFIGYSHAQSRRIRRAIARREAG